MWEERSCRQTREWQHWGSGCYNYNCKHGRLHVIVANYTYECFFAGQELHIRIMHGGWLHKGSILCPPCKELCEAEFAEQGEHCKVGEEAPPLNFFPRDELKCGGASNVNHSFSLNVILASLLLIYANVVR